MKWILIIGGIFLVILAKRNQELGSTATTQVNIGAHLADPLTPTFFPPGVALNKLAIGPATNSVACTL